MTLDYSRYPTDLVGSGNVKGKEKPLTVDDLRRKIPAHCFKPSNVRSFLYLLRDFSSVALFAWLAHIYISLIPNPPLRWLAWALYGWIQGLAFTGSWVQGHEAGHGAVSTSRIINDVVGFLVHSALLTPYFSWNSTHRRHHIYHNNLEKDVSHVPLRLQQYAIHLGITPERLEKMEELGGDVPLVLIIRIIMQQLLGWPLYLLNNVSASTGSMYRPRSKTLLGNSHFLPGPTIFRPEEAHLILASDIGLLSMMAILYYAGLTWGFANVALFYRQPYLWVNHWIVCITFLHHNAPNVPKYMPELWTFLKGGLATVDRDYG